MLVKMDDATAETTVTAFGSILNRIDAQKRLFMTYDQGREMAQHARLTENTGVAVYFADPHSPWPRGINENTNGLLRQYFPKGSDLSGFSQAELDAVAWKLNTRARKSLSFRCPAERLCQSLSTSLSIIMNLLHFDFETATEDIRWKQRFNNYLKALQTLIRAVALTEQREFSELEQQGLIQSLEFKHELAWNVLKDYQEEQGFVDLIGPKNATREAF